MTNSNRKGKDGEREFAAALKEAGFDARRGQQYQGGPDSPDVISAALEQFHFEVKRTEALRIHEAMKQAVEESKTERFPGGEKDLEFATPVVAHRRNRGGWLVIMRLEDWVELVR